MGTASTKTTQDSIHLGERATVYQAKIIAITAAHIDFFKQKITDGEVNFYSVFIYFG